MNAPWSRSCNANDLGYPRTVTVARIFPQQSMATTRPVAAWATAQDETPLLIRPTADVILPGWKLIRPQAGRAEKVAKQPVASQGMKLICYKAEASRPSPSRQTGRLSEKWWGNGGGSSAPPFTMHQRNSILLLSHGAPTWRFAQ
jgi:hypothetical protein